MNKVLSSASFMTSLLWPQQRGSEIPHRARHEVFGEWLQSQRLPGRQSHSSFAEVPKVETVSQNPPLGSFKNQTAGIGFSPQNEADAFGSPGGFGRPFRGGAGGLGRGRHLAAAARLTAERPPRRSRPRACPRAGLQPPRPPRGSCHRLSINTGFLHIQAFQRGGEETQRTTLTPASTTSGAAQTGLSPKNCIQNLAQTLTLIFEHRKAFRCLALSVVIICECAAFELCCHPRLMR